MQLEKSVQPLIESIVASGKSPTPTLAVTGRLHLPSLSSALKVIMW